MGYYDEWVCKCGDHTSSLSSDRDGWDCDYETALGLNGHIATHAYYQEHGVYPTFLIHGAKEESERDLKLSRLESMIYGTEHNVKSMKVVGNDVYVVFSIT